MCYLTRSVMIVSYGVVLLRPDAVLLADLARQAMKKSFASTAGSRAVTPEERQPQLYCKDL